MGIGYMAEEDEWAIGGGWALGAEGLWGLWELWGLRGLRGLRGLLYIYY